MRLKTVYISNRTNFFWKRVPEPWRCYHKSSLFLKIVINKNFEYNPYFKNKLKRAYLDRCWISVFTFSTAYLGYEENQMFNVADLLSSVELFFCIFW